MQRPATSTSGSAQSGQLRGNRGTTGASLAAAASGGGSQRRGGGPGRAQTGELGRRPVGPEATRTSSGTAARMAMAIEKGKA